jgi:hypothetical protein
MTSKHAIYMLVSILCMSEVEINKYSYFTRLI